MCENFCVRAFFSGTGIRSENVCLFFLIFSSVPAVACGLGREHLAGSHQHLLIHRPDVPGVHPTRRALRRHPQRPRHARRHAQEGRSGQGRGESAGQRGLGQNYGLHPGPEGDLSNQDDPSIEEDSLDCRYLSFKPFFFGISTLDGIFIVCIFSLHSAACGNLPHQPFFVILQKVIPWRNGNELCPLQAHPT